jgi:hypothetical protein
MKNIGYRIIIKKIRENRHLTGFIDSENTLKNMYMNILLFFYLLNQKQLLKFNCYAIIGNSQYN